MKATKKKSMINVGFSHLAVLSVLLYVNALKLCTALTFHLTKSCVTHTDTVICWLTMVQKFMMEPC